MLSDHPAGLGKLENCATAGVVLLAVGSFVLSYDALHQLAVANRVPRPLAWIWPLIVDGFIVTASLAVLHAVLAVRSATYPWLLVLAFSTTSVVFNVLHAPPTVVARLVAAIPPLTLVLSFELLMRQLRHRLSSPPRPAPVTTREAPQGRTAIAENAREPSASMLDRAREICRRHAEDGTPMTGKKLGETLGVSDGYGRRLLRQLETSQPDAAR